MKEPESPRFLASGQWVDQDEEEPKRPVAGLGRRRDRKARTQRSWEEMFALHDEILHRWSAYELDPARLIDYPLMTDLREPVTADMIRAMRRATRLRPDGASGHRRPASDSEYGQAVHAFEEAFLLAEAEAKRVKRGHFSEQEQQRLQTARQLLNVATDESSSPAERQGAYQQLRRAVDGLVAIPDTALAALEARNELRRHAADIRPTAGRPRGAGNSNPEGTGGPA
ncbi:hypothetical protein [Arthrobacter castelli]|uniref:hypothetical protein n=1 Tax=Arthrobacter castelli TaxID=271431 RepID=UPI00041AEF6B|nr:hypothetical protein [Arthrobacter castelli]